MVLTKDFKEFIELLNVHKVHYLVVGGYAVAFYGHPRYTKDIDFWILPEPANAAKILTVLSAFGFSMLDLKLEDFTAENRVIQLGQPPNRIDLMTTASGVDFDDCFEDSVATILDGIEVRFISLEKLKQNKLASGRYKDLGDLEHLQ